MTTPTISVASKSRQWMKRFIWAFLLIVVVSVIISIFGGWHGNWAGHTTTREHWVELCNIPPGKRTFSIQNGREVVVFVDDHEYDITDTIRVNKAKQGETFGVMKHGCVDVTFVDARFQGIKFDRPAIVAITFE
jgi:hypothetical protein